MDTNSIQYRLSQRSIGAWGPKDDRARCSEIYSQVQTYKEKYESGDNRNVTQMGSTSSG